MIVFKESYLRIEEVKELSAHPLAHRVLILFEDFLVRLGKFFISVVVLATVHHICGRRFC